MMEPYANASGKSAITQFEAGADFIKIKIKRKGTYLYTYGTTGREHVDKMKELAKQGRGLSRYISSVVKGRYASKEEVSLIRSLLRIGD
jgi:hypothetical protein